MDPRARSGADSEALPGYRFVRTIGYGGSGQVDLMVQSGTERLVAVKQLYRRRTDPDERQRLLREGRALATLEHPAIVKVYDVVVAADQPVALVMEYLAGGNAGDAVGDGALSGSSVIDALGAVAAALDHAASVGVVHRDLKPTNVLLDPEGKAKLGDFGLARFTRFPTSFRTSGSRVLGTPLYMAPERIADPDLESASVDHYAFAVMAYWFLTRDHPYPATTVAEVLSAHCHATPVDPRDRVAELPADVAAALAQGLAKDPERRATPQEIVAVLRRHGAADWDGWLGPARPDRGVGPGGADAGTHIVGSFSPDVASTAPGDGFVPPVDPAPPAAGRRTVTGPTTGTIPDRPFTLPEVPTHGNRRRALALRIALGVLVGLVAVAIIVVATRW